MHWSLSDIIDHERAPLHDAAFIAGCKRTLDADGALVLPQFLTPAAVAAVQRDGADQQHLAYYTVGKHNIYLRPADPTLAVDHPRNREVSSSKGCITTDQIPAGSVLRALYDAPQFRAFVCAVLGEAALYA